MNRKVLLFPALVLSLTLGCLPALGRERQPNADYRARRVKLASTLDGGVALMFAPPEASGPNAVYGYFPDPSFYYLTGWGEPGAALLVAPWSEAKPQLFGGALDRPQAWARLSQGRRNYRRRSRGITRQSALGTGQALPSARNFGLYRHSLRRRRLELHSTGGMAAKRQRLRRGNFLQRRSSPARFSAHD